jgi:DnaJ-class molecular chaperone
MTNFEEIDEARRLLELGESATLKKINSAYRGLAHEYHPDKHSGTTEVDTERIKKLNWAYKVLMDYCNDYKYSFQKEDVARTYPHDEYIRKFYHGWFDGI